VIYFPIIAAKLTQRRPTKADIFNDNDDNEKRESPASARELRREVHRARARGHRAAIWRDSESDNTDNAELAGEREREKRKNLLPCPALPRRTFTARRSGSRPLIISRAGIARDARRIVFYASQKTSAAGQISREWRGRVVRKRERKRETERGVLEIPRVSHTRSSASNAN